MYGVKKDKDVAMNQELHLLVVEDQPVIQQIHITSLSRLGCRVTLAMNGEETHPLACKPFIQNHCRLKCIWRS